MAIHDFAHRNCFARAIRDFLKLDASPIQMHAGVVVLHEASIDAELVDAAVAAAKGVSARRGDIGLILVFGNFRFGQRQAGWTNNKTRASRNRLIFRGRMPTAEVGRRTRPDPIAVVDIELIVKHLILHERKHEHEAAHGGPFVALSAAWHGPFGMPTEVTSLDVVESGPGRAGGSSLRDNS